MKPLLGGLPFEFNFYEYIYINFSGANNNRETDCPLIGTALSHVPYSAGKKRLATKNWSLELCEN